MSAEQPDQDGSERRTFERIVPELLKKVIETGTKNLSADSIRQMVGELKLPKEAIHYTFSQLDETKHGVYRVLAKELQEFLERTNLADEFAKALSLLALEVKMEVRFKPTNADEQSSTPIEVKIRKRPSNAPPSDEETSK